MSSSYASFFAESYIDEQLNSTYVLRDLVASGKIVGSIRAEVGDDDVVYLGPFAVAPDLQVGTDRAYLPCPVNQVNSALDKRRQVAVPH